MRIDLRRMPMPDLLQLLKDLANELQSRGRGPMGARGGQPNGNYIGHSSQGGGYGTPSYGGGFSQGHGGYGNSRFGGGGGGGGGGPFPPRGGKGGGHRKGGGGRRQDFRQRQPMEPPAPIDDAPSRGRGGSDSGNEA